MITFLSDYEGIKTFTLNYVMCNLSRSSFSSGLLRTRVQGASVLVSLAPGFLLGSGLRVGSVDSFRRFSRGSSDPVERFQARRPLLLLFAPVKTESLHLGQPVFWLVYSCANIWPGAHRSAQSAGLRFPNCDLGSVGGENQPSEILLSVLS